MPNWTYNRLTVHGPPARLREFAEHAEAAPSEDGDEIVVLDFEQHVPTPAELFERPNGDDLPDWMLWRREHWGTKWTAIAPVREGAADDGQLDYSFSTAWSPPDAWLSSVSAMHPEFRFEHEYAEEMGHFAGRGAWVAGELVEHEQLDPYAVKWMDWEEEAW